MELWGGHECTVNRVGERYRDQTRLTGHQDRIGDLARFAALGITKLRYPVLWERVAPDRPDERDWRWSDERLAEIDRLGMEPIVGLLHHGSGPRYTDLTDPGFADLFERYAAAAARRYPHVTDWTPINEPLTTARFSALYGHWYPHARDEGLFWRALLNQIDGIRGAMRAIRQENPAARLVQTEDLGEYFSTAELAGAAAHLNSRRWMTWDLLAGRVTPEHELWSHVAAHGLGDRLRAIADDPCPADIVGVNHYPTSERFIDHRLDGYPGDPPAAGYHDLVAIRVLDPPPPGLPGLLRQAWDRYGTPLAVTECHLGCTREEQLRWLWRSWQACTDLAAEGVEICALTAWALLGNVDWTSLITAEAGHYEVGAFDVRSDPPRTTAIARLLHQLGSGDAPAPAAFPALSGPGWWQRAMRLEHPPFILAGQAPSPPSAPATVPPLIVVDRPGALHRALTAACEMRGLPCLLIDPATLREDGAAFLDKDRPWAVIDSYLVDHFCAETAALARACSQRGIACLLFSSAPPSHPPDGALVLSPAAATPSMHSGDLIRSALDALIDGERGTWTIPGGRCCA